MQKDGVAARLASPGVVVHCLSIATKFNDLGYYGFFDDFELRDTFQERITPKTIEINVEKLRMKFLALNADFNGPSLDFLGWRKRAHEGIKERYPHKSHYFAIVGQSFVKMLAIHHNKH